MKSSQRWIWLWSLAQSGTEDAKNGNISSWLEIKRLSICLAPWKTRISFCERPMDVYVYACNKQTIAQPLPHVLQAHFPCSPYMLLSHNIYKHSLGGYIATRIRVERESDKSAKRTPVRIHSHRCMHPLIKQYSLFIIAGDIHGWSRRVIHKHSTHIKKTPISGLWGITHASSGCMWVVLRYAFCSINQEHRLYSPSFSFSLSFHSSHGQTKALGIHWWKSDWPEGARILNI